MDLREEIIGRQRRYIAIATIVAEQRFSKVSTGTCMQLTDLDMIRSYQECRSTVSYRRNHTARSCNTHRNACRALHYIHAHVDCALDFAVCCPRSTPSVVPVYGVKTSYLSVSSSFSMYVPRILSVKSAVHSVKTWLDKFVCLCSACADSAHLELVE